MRQALSIGASALTLSLSLTLALCLAGTAAPAIADDLSLCNALEQARDPLYEVPMGEEDWPRIDALENAARALDCTFMINE
jgi:hypothetical protein